jgi:hypothetical protein
VPPAKPELRERLIALAEHDMHMRAQLAATGALYQGYHPDMQRVHEANAAELESLIGSLWPVAGDVGEDGLNAAWTIVQHAIAMPEFQRRYLAVIKRAVSEGAVPAWQAAMLEDRIRFFEGRPQVYGTQFDWDAAGEMSPLPIDDPANVDARRRAVGLETLADAISKRRAEAARGGERKPADRAMRQQAFEDWARKVGWRA